MEYTSNINDFVVAASGLRQDKCTKTSAFSKLNRYIYRYKYLLSTLIFLSILLSPQLSSLAQAPSNSNNGSVSNNLVEKLNESEIFYLKAINQLRSQKNLKPLIFDSRLSKSANDKADDMNNKKYWGHYAPIGKSFADFIWINSPNAESVGENLAKCFSSKQEAFDALVASPTHYAIMTGNFSNFGVSELLNKNDGCTYTVMHFSQYKQ